MVRAFEPVRGVRSAGVGRRMERREETTLGMRPGAMSPREGFGVAGAWPFLMRA
jgi:hypothetical protein